MTQDPLAAARRLAETLAEENAALDRLDLARAASLAGAKSAMIEAFTAARGQAVSAGRRAEMLRALEQLNQLAAENRRLLQRALQVQERVIGVVTAAAARAASREAPVYGAKGGARLAPATAPLALSARV